MFPVVRVLFFCQLARLAVVGKAKSVPVVGKAKSVPNTTSAKNIGEENAPYLVVFSVKQLFGNGSGNFTVQVNPEWAPRGAERFATLVRERFFVNSRFFRVIKDFIAQFGIHADPKVSHLWLRRNMKDDRVLVTNLRGRLSFATAGKNSRSTQMFINFKDNSFLDKEGFSPFAEVLSGMDVVDKLYAKYGEGGPVGEGPDQEAVQNIGNEYLTQYYPELSYIESVSFLGWEPPIGTNDYYNGAFPGLDGFPATFLLLLLTVGGFLFGRCVAQNSFQTEVKGPRSPVATHATCVGTVSLGFWLWAAMNTFVLEQWDLGVVTFLLTFLTSALAHKAANGLVPCWIRWYCRLMPLTCILVAINYGLAIYAGPDFFTFTLYCAVGVIWWTVAGCSSLALAIKLLKEGKEAKMHGKYAQTQDGAVIGVESEL